MIPESAVGLIRGRHDMPVSRYIFEDVENVLDFAELQRIADCFVAETCNIQGRYGAAVNHADLGDIRLWKGDPLDVVVTGLTACTTAVMYACAKCGVPLTLWHFDRETGDYVPQFFQF